MPSEPRLLIIADIGVGPPRHGNRSRMRALLQACRALGYEIHFAGVRLSSEERAATLPYVDKWVADFDRPPRRLLALRRVASTLLRITRSLTPFLRRRSPAASSDVDKYFLPHWSEETVALQQREQYDLVLVAYVFNSAFLQSFPASTRKVIDTHDVFADRNQLLVEQGLSSDDGWISLTRAAEIKGLRRANVILGIQKHESDYFQSVVGDVCEVYTVGYTPETAFQSFTPAAEQVVGYLAGANRLNIAGFHAFTEQVWPLVLQRQPQVRLTVAGGICETLGKLPDNVTAFGPVHDARDFYRRCSATINPTFAGTGLKIKTIESLAYGRACITTPHAAVGLEDFLGRGLLVANTPAEFAAAIIGLCSDPIFAEQSGQAGFDAFRNWRQHSLDELRQALSGP